MFFARVRWISRVLEGAGIDTNSKTGRELTTTLIKYSKYLQAKNLRGEGASGLRLNVGPADWALLGSIYASEEPRVCDQVSTALGISEPEAIALVARVRDSAVKLAEQGKPSLLERIGLAAPGDGCVLSASEVGNAGRNRGGGRAHWVKVVLLGLVFWYALTFAEGTIEGFLGLPYVRETSDFWNFVFLLPGFWIAHRVLSRRQTRP